MTDRMVWVDLETFGLDPETDPIIEVGLRVTDLEGRKIDHDYQGIIWSEYHDVRLATMEASANGGNEQEKLVLDMHTKSGLWDDAMNQGKSWDTVLDEIGAWLKNTGTEGLPMCGSSVHFDRKFLYETMQEVEEAFHYRNVDISTLKELCASINPAVYAKLAVLTTPKKRHRVIDDLDDTIEEYKFYLDNFLFAAPEMSNGE